MVTVMTHDYDADGHAILVNVNGSKPATFAYDLARNRTQQWNSNHGETDDTTCTANPPAANCYVTFAYNTFGEM